jgi:hypothetical protein
MSTYNVSNSGSGSYIINGLNNPTLNLIRGQTYTFNINASGHPFWIQTTTIPYNSGNVYNTGITGNGTQVGTLIFNVQLSAPNTLYYVCQFHTSMNGIINISDPPCYSKGTLILTNEGYKPIENIKKGDKVLVKGKIYKNVLVKNSDNKEEPVKWISKFNVKNLNSKSRPICIKKDAFGHGYPFVDLYVSPGHKLFVNDKTNEANSLINNKTIYQDNECEYVEYYHLECEKHCAIYANGILAETYKEHRNNRNIFDMD